ncbi:MAG: hypothetical protein IPJ24_04765 [bacterium]|nr:hypothetical protein [bacterium]
MVSPVGMNVEVLAGANVGRAAAAPGEAAAAIIDLLRDEATRRSLGRAGRLPGAGVF